MTVVGLVTGALWGQPMWGTWWEWDPGYEKAMSAILDANITTFIAAVILFVMGSGPVRGFSITLGLGILTSVFTAIFVTRLLVVMWFERRRPKTIEV